MKPMLPSKRPWSHRGVGVGSLLRSRRPKRLSGLRSLARERQTLLSVTVPTRAKTLARSLASPAVKPKAAAVPDRYRVGALAIGAQNWPADWHAYAAREYPREDFAHTTPVTLEVASNALHDKEWALGAEQRLEITKTNDGHRFYVKDAFDALYANKSIQVTSVSRYLGAHFTLCNILRAVSSVCYALDFDGLMLHAGCGILDGRGVVFCGKSGAGKTTISLGMKATTYLSDDITLVTDISTAPHLVGTPFYGSRGVGGAQLDAPLSALGILGQSMEGTEISPFPMETLVPELLRHVVCFTTDPHVVGTNLERVLALADNVFVASVVRDLRDSADTVVNALLAARDQDTAARPLPR